MTTIDDVTQTVNAFAAAQVAAAVQPLEAQVTAAQSALTVAQAALAVSQAAEGADETVIAQLRAQIVALQAQLTPSIVYPFPILKWSTRQAGETVQHFLSRQTSPCIVDFEGTAATFSDFAQGAWSAGGWGLLGGNVMGFLNAKLSMALGSSTKAAYVNALTKGATTNFQLARLGLGANVNVLRPAFFTGELDGTSQGHQYTGMQSYETDHAVFGPFKIKGIVGKAGGEPPWEVFAWGSYHDTNPTWTDFEIDGTDASGTPVSAAGIGLGPQDKGGVYNYTRGYIHDLAFGGGITHYEITNATINFTDMKFDRIDSSAINFEKCDGSVVTILRPSFGDHPVDIVADSNTGSAKITIEDPVLTAAHPQVVVCVHTLYDYPGPDVDANKQLRSDITLTVGGQPRPDLLKFVTSYTPKQ